jgi:leucyl-tRNA synthetase
MVIKDGAKMSKSKGNVVDPDDLIRTLRRRHRPALLAVRRAAREGPRLERSRRGRRSRFPEPDLALRRRSTTTSSSPAVAITQRSVHRRTARSFRRTIHETIKRVTDDIEGDFHFNTAVSAIMELVNALYAFEAAPPDRLPAASAPALLREAVETTLLLLGPFCPHVTEELWQHLGHAQSVFAQTWPAADPAALARREVTVGAAGGRQGAWAAHGRDRRARTRT